MITPYFENIIERYGQPNQKKKLEQNKEEWIYKSEFAVDCVVIGLIIPVPICYPAGYRTISFEFEDRTLMKVAVERPETTSAFLCGVLFVGHLGFGCYVK